MVDNIVKNLYKSLFIGVGTALITSATLALADSNARSSQNINAAIKPLILAEADINEDDANLDTDKDIITRHNTSTTRDKFISYKIKEGDSLSTIFIDLGLSTYDLQKILHNRKFGHEFTDLEVGKILNFKINSRNQLNELSYLLDAGQTVSATRHINDFNISSSTNQLNTRYATAHVVINSSLEKAGKNAGLSYELTNKLAEIFAWDIDFAQNLQPNDQFTVVYEQKLSGKKVVGTGDIVAAEFINQGESHQAVRFIDDEGNVNYLSPKGEGLRKAFLSAPLEYAKISSQFSTHRNHPILNRIRAHKGVDYAASTGTPVRSTGDGKITYQGIKGGYGQVVTVDHGHGYATLYAHLSKFQSDLQEGDNVKQGQIIGYVGRTGLATGPHLHYEFLVNGEHQDPLTVKLTDAMPIDKSLMASFKAQTRPLLAQLEQAKSTMLAKNSREE